MLGRFGACGLVLLLLCKGGLAQDLAQRQAVSPATAKQTELSALLEDVMRKQRQMNVQLGEYTSQFTSTRREYDKQGRLKKESITSGESYQSCQRNLEIDLLQDGQPLPEKKIEQERQRAIKALTRDAVERARMAGQLAQDGLEYGTNFNGVRLSSFDIIRYCLTGNLRREQWLGRPMLVVDFRPHPNYVVREKALYSLQFLSGSFWIDEADRVIVKLIARVPDRADGGGIAFHEEQTRMPDGMWVHQYMRLNCASKPEIFNNQYREWIYERQQHQKFTAQSVNETLEAVRVKP